MGGGQAILFRITPYERRNPPFTPDASHHQQITDAAPAYTKEKKDMIWGIEDLLIYCRTLSHKKQKEPRFAGRGSLLYVDYTNTSRYTFTHHQRPR